jgi:hypothetical protein
MKRYDEPQSIRDALRRIEGDGEDRGLIGDIADIEAQLSDKTKQQYMGAEYQRWRNAALKSCRLKCDELRYLKRWVVETRVDSKIREATEGGTNARSLLKRSRDVVEMLTKRHDDTDPQVGELLHALDLYLQHIA